MRAAMIAAGLIVLVALGVWNSPPSTELPQGVELRVLKPGEFRLQGMIPVTSDYGDWYDGCNYTASPEWNTAHGNGGGMWTSTCMACIGTTE